MARTRVAGRSLAAPPPASFWRSRRAAALLVAALAFVTYLNALDNPFIYDDFFSVTGNPSIAAAADPRWTVIHMPCRSWKSQGSRAQECATLNGAVLTAQGR